MKFAQRKAYQASDNDFAFLWSGRGSSWNSFGSRLCRLDRLLDSSDWGADRGTCELCGLVGATSSVCLSVRAEDLIERLVELA